MSRRGHMAVMLSAAAALLMVAGNARATSATVRWDGHEMCVRSDGALRADILREVARLTGTRITGIEYVRGRLTQPEACSDLANVLRSLAGNESYALTTLETEPRADVGRYALFIAMPGRAQPQRNILAGHAPATVLVEDLATGEMREVRQPPAVGYSSSVRPDAQPVSVRVDME